MEYVIKIPRLLKAKAEVRQCTTNLELHLNIHVILGTHLFRKHILQDF